MLSNARTVVLFGAFGQVFAFARTAVIAYIFGTSIQIDAYNIAISLPAFVSSLIIGWLQASFVGRYIEIAENEGEPAAQRYRSATAALVLALLIGLTVLLIVLRKPLVGLLVPATLGPTHDLTLQALLLAAFILVPSAASDYLALILSCHKKFLAASLAPIVNALVSLLALLTWPSGGLESLLYSLIVGWLAQLLMLYLAVIRGGLGFVAGRIELSDEIRILLLLFLPILPATFFSNATNLVLQSAFVRMGEGFVSTYGYAQRLNSALVQVVMVGLSTVLLPHLATLIARDARTEVVVLFDRIIRSVIVISVLGFAMVAMLGTDTILMLFGRGSFKPDQAEMVSRLWLVLTACTAPLVISTFFAKLFQALRQPAKLSMASFISFCLTALACQIGVISDNYILIAASLGIAQIFVLAYFTMNFRSQFGTSQRILHFLGIGLLTASICLLPIAIEVSLRTLKLVAPASTLATLARGALFLLLFSGLAWRLDLLARIRGKAPA